MLSIRTFARSAPRAVSRITTSSVRLSTAARPTSSLLQASWKPALRTQQLAAFSTSMTRRSKAGESDDELVAKLESELQIENQMEDDNSIPTSVKDYLENGPFEVIDTPGQEEIVLTRQFGDEKIKVVFSIADLHNIDPDDDMHDRAMEDEEDSDAINQGSPKTFAQAPEDSLSASDHEDAPTDEEDEPPLAIRLNVIVEKASRGALAIETIAQDGMIVIENVYYYANAAHAHAKTPETLYERQDLYAGPPFGNLDEDLQVLLERYLDERGVNTALALFVPDYVGVKEQKEYLRWLENLKGFVEA